MNSETINQLLLEAANLMLVGMVVVFAFLTLLILGVNGLASFCRRFLGQEPEAPKRASVKRTPTTTQNQTQTVDGQLVAAISAAVHSHRQANR